MRLSFPCRLEIAHRHGMRAWSPLGKLASRLCARTAHSSRLADTTIASPSIVTPSTTVLASARTYRRIFAMRPPPVAPDTFGEVESYGKRAPSGPLRGRSCQSYLFPTRELGKAVGGHPHKLPKSLKISSCRKLVIRLYLRAEAIPYNRQVT